MADAKLGADVKLTFGLAVVLTLIGLAIDNGAVGWLIALMVLPLLFYAMSRAPLRSSLFVLMFCALTLENPSEMPASGQWKSPLFMLGSLMLTHLKQTIGGSFFFSGMDLMLATLGIITWMRRSSGNPIDRIGQFATPRPMIKLAHLALGGILFVWVMGKIRGGADNSMAMWQIDRVMYVPLIFLLFSAGLRGPQDAVTLAKVILMAGTWRALQARYVMWTLKSLAPDPVTGEPAVAYATTHHDSMLFAWTTVLIVALLVHRYRNGTGKLALFLLPILVSGMLANNRRLVWVQIIIVFITLYFLTGPSAMKRKIQTGLKIIAPVVALYVAAGWGSGSGIFKPVRIIRSAVDSKADSSTAWRDIENFDLLYTFRQFPIFGSGYGRGFWEIMPLPAVDYQLERFVPHNSILGLWTYCGLIGYTAITMLWVSGVYFGIRAYHASTSARDKSAALVCFGGLLIHYLQCYGDMGLGSWTGVFMVAPSLAMAGKLAVSNGAWLSNERSGAKFAAKAPGQRGGNTRVPGAF